MKRLTALLTAVMLLGVLLCGCGKDKKTPDAARPSPTAAPTAAVTVKPTVKATVPAAAPTDAPTEAPTEAPETVDAAWFNDAVFIGDSVTVALDCACADDPSLLGDAKFVCAQSLGYHNALWSLDTEGAIHPTYEGETVLAETAAQITGARKVFILLGTNDIGTYGPEDTLEKAKELAGRILSHTPNVDLYFQSTTPMIAKKESGWLNNTKIARFNAMLKAYCEEQGYHFIDVYAQVCDENGKLKTAYCGDPDGQGIHFNGAGCKAWAAALKAGVANPFGDNEPDVINYQIEMSVQPATQPPAAETAGE